MSNRETFKDLSEVSPASIETSEPAAGPPEADSKHASKLHPRLQRTKRLIQAALVTAEAAPFAQEALRYGPIFAGTLAATGSPEAAGAALAGSTLLVEGVGALAAAELLSSGQSTRMLNWANRQVRRVIPEGAQVPPYAEIPIAMTAGTPALLAAKSAADPSRTLEQNRRHGLFTATWMATLLGAEGGILGKSIENYNDPRLWTASAVALGGLGLIVGTTKRLAKKDAGNTSSESARPHEKVKRSAEFYEKFRGSNDEAMKIGLYGEDLEKALLNPDSMLLSASDEKGDSVDLPLLVPADDLEWYDPTVLRRLYGEDKRFYYYAHPPLPEDQAGIAAVQTAIADKLQAGAVIITDCYASQPDSLDVLRIPGYSLEAINAAGEEYKNDVFVGRVNFDGEPGINQAPSVFEAYQAALSAGEVSVDPDNGTAMVDHFDDEAAEDIWRMYEKPFAKLGADDPSPAGFDKEAFIGLMQDPQIAKLVYRDSGKITSLCFFLHDFDKCPWFNRKFYEKEFPNYYQTGNILIFPGIVSDENAKGTSYSGQLIDLAMKLYKKRGSDALITFECTEISTRYIPRIVARAIDNSRAGSVKGLQAPVSTVLYKALRKTTSD